jgi:hypothetical protein
MSEQEKRFYRVTHVVEITEYIEARSPRIALAINYGRSSEVWSGKMRTLSETVEGVEEPPTAEQLTPINAEVPRPYVKAGVIFREEAKRVYLPVEIVEQEGFDRATDFLCGDKVEVIACKKDTYYLYQTNEVWRPLSEREGER